MASVANKQPHTANWKINHSLKLKAVCKVIVLHGNTGTGKDHSISVQRCRGLCCHADFNLFAFSIYIYLSHFICLWMQPHHCLAALSVYRCRRRLRCVVLYIVPSYVYLYGCVDCFGRIAVYQLAHECCVHRMWVAGCYYSHGHTYVHTILRPLS